MKSWHANLLPKSAVEILQQAAKTPITQDDPLARAKAIEKSIARVKRNWPQYFRDVNQKDQNGSGQ